jgi:hypothetical protein
VIGPPGPSSLSLIVVSLAYEPNYLTVRVDYGLFALSIEVIPHELRKDSKLSWVFEEAEVRSQSQSVVPCIADTPCNFWATTPKV